MIFHFVQAHSFPPSFITMIRIMAFVFIILKCSWIMRTQHNCLNCNRLRPAPAYARRKLNCYYVSVSPTLAAAWQTSILSQGKLLVAWSADFEFVSWREISQPYQTTEKTFQSKHKQENFLRKQRKLRMPEVSFKKSQKISQNHQKKQK